MKEEKIKPFEIMQNEKFTRWKLFIIYDREKVKKKNKVNGTKKIKHACITTDIIMIYSTLFFAIVFER